jgi:IS30 family transposase
MMPGAPKAPTGGEISMAGGSLSLVEREEVRAGLERGESCAEIARVMGRAGSSVSREVARNGGVSCYSAVEADERARRCRQRSRPSKFMSDWRLARTVTADLRAGYSPAGIAVRLREAGGSTACHETIYRALYSPTFQGLGLRGQDCLRMRRRRRLPHGRAKTQYRRWMGAFKLIDARPAAAFDRSEPGHWEGDLIIGRDHGSAMVTLVERVSRMTMLARLPRRHTATEVRAALRRVFADVPDGMRASLTWDQGSEIRLWRLVERDLAMPVFLCHPHSPWQRPSNEHTNRQLRYWFPKGSDLSKRHQHELDHAASVLNTLPRRLLEWHTPQHIYDRLTDALTA